MSVNAVQHVNALNSMLVTLFGKVMRVSVSQSENAKVPMIWVPSGTVYTVSFFMIG